MSKSKYIGNIFHKYSVIALITFAVSLFLFPIQKVRLVQLEKVGLVEEVQLKMAKVFKSYRLIT